MWLVKVIVLLTAAGLAKPNPLIQKVTSTPVSAGDLRVFPGDLVCDKREDTLSNEGPTWMGITVGQSTLTDVERLLLTFSDDYVFVDDDDRDTRFVNFDHLDVTNRSNLVAETPSVVRLCLDEDVVQVLSVTYINYPLPRLYLGDLLVNFGEPDAVTWENDPTGRVVFWFEQGIAVSVSVFPNSPDAYPTFGRVGTEIYFPYQDPTNFEDRWPYNQTRECVKYLV
jgi:hypothetical protein